LIVVSLDHQSSAHAPSSVSQPKLKHSILQ
jgi:hypothetical protein